MPEPIQIVIGPDVKCPRCGAVEVEDNTLPVDQWVWNIRPNKVCDASGKWWSQCLKCADKGFHKGWFCS